MTAVEHALHSALVALQELNARYALVGGLAVSAWAEPRFTRDVDFAVAVDDDAQAEALVYALCVHGYQIAATIDHVPTGRLGTVRLAAATRPPVMTDLLFASSGIEDLVVAEAQKRAVLHQLSAPVARPGHLVALKLLAQTTGREHDTIDLQQLKHVLNPLETAAARQAVALIVERGFHRERDLSGLLEAYLAAPPADPHALV